MPGINRLLEVENRLVLPLETPILLVFTSLDVIHAWALPAYGLKVDCVAGLLNRQAVYFTHPGLYFGQCSEVCGVGHRFIPIVVEVVPYRFWLA